MFWIICIKVLLVIFSILSLGIIPLLALLNQWIWNSIIIQHVITCGIPITSYWICLGLTFTGGCLLGHRQVTWIWDIWKKKSKSR